MRVIIQVVKAIEISSIEHSDCVNYFVNGHNSHSNLCITLLIMHMHLAYNYLQLFT